MQPHCVGVLRGCGMHGTQAKLCPPLSQERAQETQATSCRAQSQQKKLPAILLSCARRQAGSMSDTAEAPHRHTPTTQPAPKQASTQSVGPCVLAHWLHRGVCVWWPPLALAMCFYSMWMCINAASSEPCTAVRMWVQVPAGAGNPHLTHLRPPNVQGKCIGHTDKRHNRPHDTLLQPPVKQQQQLPPALKAHQNTAPAAIERPAS